MEIYLIRHTTVDIKKGLCYGQSEIPLHSSFDTEAGLIKKFVPSNIEMIHSSPLKRCRQLAEYLFPERKVVYRPELMEIHCGEWEMRYWDEIPQAELDPWMTDFVNVSIPGGESYVQLYDRVRRGFENIASENKTAAIISHGGVIRSILSYLTNTSLKDSFKAFSLHYGCVIRVFQKNGRMEYETLSNVAPLEKESHKPSSFSR
ncbi:MAG: alpha-ribazole phosphatase [Bacteroidetes bacterium]|nr:MAG: alpha-ribazole phosphatase [Bacteroidota bacterium]